MDYNLMTGWWGGSFGLFGGLSQIVWFIVGILLVIWLWKQVIRK